MSSHARMRYVAAEATPPAVNRNRPNVC
jgi:hypothetical protein